MSGALEIENEALRKRVAQLEHALQLARPSVAALIPEDMDESEEELFADDVEALAAIDAALNAGPIA